MPHLGQRKVEKVRRSGAESASAPQTVQQAARRKENQPAGKAPRPKPGPVAEEPEPMSDHSAGRPRGERFRLVQLSVNRTVLPRSLCCWIVSG